jgi:hypothetical protein
MKELLKTLETTTPENRVSILLEIEKLNEFLNYSFSQPEYRSYMLDYLGDLVRIELMGRDTIIRIKDKKL